MAKTRYEVSGYLKMAEEDSFAEGCLIDSGTTFVGDERFSAPTVENLIDQLRAFVPFRTEGDAVDVNACDEDGRIDISGMETDDCDEPTAAQLEAWKRGEYRLWYVTYSFQVEQITRRTVHLERETAVTHGA